MKRPAFQFYPGDWQRDAALRACSVGARGLWIEMMCVMHQAEPYGYLVLNGNPIESAQLARMVGASEKEVTRWMAELSAAGVHSFDENGQTYSRRMVRDEALRNARAEGGKLGGNPALVGTKVDGKVNHKVENKDNQNPTPSSSSSSSKESKSLSSGKPSLKTLTDLGVDEQIAKDWMAIRKAKRAPLTDTALDELKCEASKAGIAVSEAVAICAKRSWQGFKASWNWREDLPAPLASNIKRAAI